jgi:DNA repair exonuclease SbcCD ATPase subunit
MSESVEDLQAEVERLRGELVSVTERATSAESALAEAEQARAAAASEASAAVERLRGALFEGPLDLPKELVQGQTVTELDASIEATRSAFAAFQEHADAQARAGRVTPSGVVGQRQAVDLSGLSPEAKIRIGLEQRYE